MTFRMIAVLLICCAFELRAEPIARVDVAFRSWAAEVAVTDAALVLQRDGAVQLEVGLGDATAQRPMELASLSKAITAACVAELLRAGAWTSETTSHEVLQYGREGITVAALLTHSSGLMPDMTQLFMGFWLGGDTSRADYVAKATLGRAAQTGTPGTYAYNNENYAILGEMIATQTGQPYRAACTERVLQPAGVQNAAPSPQTGPFLPWGGWRMSVTDYARFVEWAYGPDGIVGGDVARLPAQAVSPEVSYGMGMFQRSRGPGYNYWHFGALCFPGTLNVGAYAVRWQGGWSVVAAYDACLTGDQMGALDRAIVAAVFG